MALTTLNTTLLQRSQFETSLSEDAPPEGLPLELSAIWWLRNSSWGKAHDLIDGTPGSDAAWVHALLHRMEGDQANANYWYARAGKSRPNRTIRQEMDDMMDHFLKLT